MQFSNQDGDTYLDLKDKKKKAKQLYIDDTKSSIIVSSHLPGIVTNIHQFLVDFGSFTELTS